MTWSYSRISTYEKCPLKYQCQYIDKLPRGEPSKALARGNRIHSLAEDYLNGLSETVPDDLKKVSKPLERLKKLEAVAEEWWHFHDDWVPSDDWAWLVIKSDAYCFPSDRTLEVTDFKTGKTYPEHRDQLHLYATGALSLFPGVEKVCARALYTDQGSAIDFEWGRKDLKIMHNNWKSRSSRIEKAKTFPPRPNRFCRWCDYNAANGGPCNEGRS